MQQISFPDFLDLLEELGEANTIEISENLKDSNSGSAEDETYTKIINAINKKLEDPNISASDIDTLVHAYTSLVQTVEL